MKILIKKIPLLFVLIFNSYAGNQLGSYYIKRSPKGLLLGDAYVARAQDDHLLFYNPASLARNDSVSASLLNFSVGANDILKDKDRFDDVADTPQGLAAQYLNYPIHVAGGTVPGVQLFNFAFSLIYNVEVNAVVSNNVNPVLDLNYRYDNGFVMGAGFPIAKSGCGKVALGGAAKYIKRTGIDDRFALVGTRILNSLDDDNEAKDVLRDLGVHTDKTWGFDFATEYSCVKGPSEFAMSLSMLDVYTKFDVPADKTLPEQPMTANFGISYKMNLGLLSAQFSADVAPMNMGLPVSQMLHAGFELGTPILSLLTGYGPGGFSYGAEIDLFFVRVIGGFYHGIMGPTKDPITQRRGIIYLSLLDFSLDL
jgi:hypothetical protein